MKLSAMRVLALCALLVACDDDGGQTSTRPYDTVELEQEVIIGGAPIEAMLLSRSGTRIRLSVPADAVPLPTRATVRLVSGVSGTGRVPLANVAVEVDAPGLMFQVPARLGVRVPPPPLGRSYTGVVAAIGTTQFMPYRVAARVQPADERGEEEWEAESNGAGVWGLAYTDAVDAGADPGGRADAGASVSRDAATGGGDPVPTRDAGAADDVGPADAGAPRGTGGPADPMRL